MLYRVLKTAANLIILLGLLLVLLGLGGSARQAYAGLALLYAAFGTQPGQPVSPAGGEGQASRPVASAGAFTPGLTAKIAGPDAADAPEPVDLAAWEEFDPAIFEQEGEGFLPFTVAAGEGFAPPMIPLTGEVGLEQPDPEPPVTAAQPEVVVQVVEPEPEFPRVPTRLVIPAIELDAPIVAVFAEPVRYDGQQYEQWQAPAQYAAGWHENSAWLGEAGNTVLNGHHNVHGSVFGRLNELAERDEIVVYSEDRAYYFRVHQVLILEERGLSPEQRAENARWIMPSQDQRLTLVTCWPPESNTHRLIVIAGRSR